MSLKKSSLASRGYKSFEEWNSDPNHVYIGRDMTHFVKGALGSEWGNPFKAKKANKNSLNHCLERYEDHIRRTPDLFNAVMELEGKEIGCWCKPGLCHGDILIKLFKERQGSNPSYQTLGEYSPITGGVDTPLRCEGKDLLISTPSVFPPLRLNGGGDTSHESQENIMDDNEHHSNSILVNDPSTSPPSNHDSQYVSNENDPLSFVSQDDSMSEQDIRDTLFDAGYTIEDINDIITKWKSNESACSDSSSCVGENVSLLDEIEDPFAILKDLKEKNSERPIIAQLNINSISSKFEPLAEMIKDNIDFLLVTENLMTHSQWGNFK